MKNRMKSIPLFFAIVLLVLTGCEQSSDTVVGIPNVRIGCTTTDDNNCSSGNSNPVVGFARLSRSGCGSSLTFDPVATGSVTLSCDASGCDGTVTLWFDSSNAPVTNILSGSIYVCAQVDLDNSSGLPNTGDLINENIRSVNSSATISIDAWTKQ